MRNIAICEDNPIHTQMIEDIVKAHFHNSVEIVHFSSATELLSAFSEADFSQASHPSGKTLVKLRRQVRRPACKRLQALYFLIPQTDLKMYSRC